MSKYSAKLLGYFYDLVHAGTLLPEDSLVVCETGTLEQGEVVKFYLKIKDETIEAVRFQCHGAVATIAACEFVSGWLEGKHVIDISMLTTGLILQELELKSFYNHVAVLILQCLNQVSARLSENNT